MTEARAVLVTGASSGLGLETCLHLAKDGFRVFAAMRDVGRSARLHEEAERLGVSVATLELDVTDRSSIERAVSEVLRRCGTLYGLVNNAGVHVRGYFEDVSDAELRRVFEVNVFGTMAVTRAVLPHMRAAGTGRIVIVSSMGGRIASPALSAYCASKFALEGFGEALALEAKLVGVNVVLVAPTIVKTGLWARSDAVAGDSSSPSSPYRNWFQNQERLSARLVASAPTKASDVATVIRVSLTAREPRLRYVVGRRAKALLALRSLLPGEIFNRIFLRVLDHLLGRELVSRA
jgi:NAD(P)-dependent dehydrogenase (short-subunit alcohol dehydrogenase family)